MPELTEIICEEDAWVAWPATSVVADAREATSPPSRDMEMEILVSFVERVIAAVRRGGAVEDIFGDVVGWWG